MKQLLYLGIALSLLLAACTPQASGVSITAAVSTAQVGTAIAATLPPADYTPPPQPTPLPPTPIPSLSGGLPPAELKYRLLDAYPDFFYCDPDLYPIARADEAQLAIERFPEIQADQDQLRVILEHNGLGGLATFTDQQKLVIYQQYKKLNAIHLELAGDRYQFQFTVGQEGGPASLLSGSIDAQGNIKIDSKQSTIATCPICLALGTLIDTPEGPKAVQDLQAGDVVWTLDAWGRRIAAPLLRVGHVPVPVTHEMIHVALEDGRGLWASPGHPLPDGRMLEDLKLGDLLDGSPILKLERVRYGGEATYDILPDGESGLYWANGILLASTLR